MSSTSSIESSATPSVHEEAAAAPPDERTAQPAMPMEQSATTTKPQSWHRVGAALLLGGGSLTAVGTLVGWLYWVGYLSVFDIPSEVFPQQVMELLLNNYGMLFIVLGKALDALNSQGPSLVLTAGLLGLAIAAGVRLLMWPPIENATESARSWARKHFQRPNVFSAAVGGVTATATVVVPVMLMMFTMLVLALPLVAYSAGRSQGAKVLENIACNSASQLAKGCMEVNFKDGAPVVGIYIASNDKAVALRVNERTVVYFQERTSMRMGTKTSTSK